MIRHKIKNSIIKKNYILALGFMSIVIGSNAQSTSSDDPIYNQNQPTTTEVNSNTIKAATIS